MNAPKNNQEFIDLAKKRENGTATEAEQKAFDEAYLLLSTRNLEWDNNLMGNESFVKQKIFSNLESRIIEHDTPKKNFVFYKYAAAVTILLSIGIVSYLQYSKHAKKDNLQVSHFEIEDTNHNKAYLTLADGSKISLTDAENGKIIQKAGISISKTKDGQVVYQVSATENTGEEAILSTISTPNGGQYMVILPDNSSVWLNASSSITFPSVFDKTARNVMIKGEVYFEVAKDPNRPFKVKCGEAEISVLGTHFNIRNYDNEPNNQVTLTEGSIQLNVGTSSRIIKPGQQALYNNKSDEIAIKNVDTDDFISWKKGYFLFDATPIEEVMREIKRWYDVDVIYEGDRPNVSITAMISRSNKIDKMLDLLKKSGGLNYEKSNKQIIVKKVIGRK